jgi:hypothetical protein
VPAVIELVPSTLAPSLKVTRPWGRGTGDGGREHSGLTQEDRVGVAGQDRGRHAAADGHVLRVRALGGDTIVAGVGGGQRSRARTRKGQRKVCNGGCAPPPEMEVVPSVVLPSLRVSVPLGLLPPPTPAVTVTLTLKD